MSSPVLIKLSGPAEGHKRERAGWGEVGRRSVCLAAVTWRKGRVVVLLWFLLKEAFVGQILAFWKGTLAMEAAGSEPLCCHTALVGKGKMTRILCRTVKVSLG